MALILGIDLGKFKSVFCLVNAETGHSRFDTITTAPDRFREYLERIRPDHVLFEVSTAAGWVADLCDALGIPVDVVNPRGDAWTWSKVKRKTDRDDAQKLVQLYLLGQLPTVHMPDAEARAYRGLILFRHRLVSRRTALRNRIRALLQARGIPPLARGQAAWTAKARATWRTRYARPLADCQGDEIWRGELMLDFDSLDTLETQITQVEAKLDELAQARPGVALLKTIPGVGPRTAEAVVAFLSDPHRFGNSRQVSAYAGLVPRQFQSGTVDRKGRVTKRGPAFLRAILVECAWMMTRHNAWAAQFVNRLTHGHRGRRKTAVVALARKLLVLCWTMLRKGQPWQNPLAIPITT